MALSVYKYLDYRKIIKDLSKESKISQKMLAASARIHTSYFSRVMKGDATFSSTQLYLIGRNLNLGDWKLDYLMLLGDLENSNDPEHRNFIQSKINHIQNEKQKTIADMENVETSFSEEYTRIYYQEAITAKIHMYLSLEKYRKNPNLILGKIHIAEFKLNQELQKLADLGILERKNKEIKLLRSSVHLDEASPMIANTHINWRLEAIQHISKRTPRPSDHHISAVFTTSEEGKLKIRENFKKFVIDAQKIASEETDNEEVFHLNFDLF